MSVIPCEQNQALQREIERLADVIKAEAHTLGGHGLSKREFHDSGLFRGAIERIRGQFAASMEDKRDFARQVLDYMKDAGYIGDWESASEKNRHDYVVSLTTGRTAIIELKGCLDGNNTNIFDRPTHAQEFVIWSVCTNPGANPRRNAWSGIHTRLSAEIISRNQQVDGVIVWDMVCGTTGRPCPKILSGASSIIEIGPYELPPPCIYVFPATVPSPRNNPRPRAQNLSDVEILAAFGTCFKSSPSEINYVDFEVEYRGSDTLRTTRVFRNGAMQKTSKATPIRRA